MIFTHFSLGLFANNLCSKLKTILCGKEIKIGNRIKTTKRKKKIISTSRKTFRGKKHNINFLFEKKLFWDTPQEKTIKGSQNKIKCFVHWRTYKSWFAINCLQLFFFFCKGWFQTSWSLPL